MKIVVLNGSPKGDQSVTMQHILYVQKKIPKHEYKILNVAHKIKLLEKNEQKFQEIMDEIKASDCVIWGFPLYVMLISSQFKRFIELIFERNEQDVFKNKYTMIFMTSIHFYDHTAQNYMHAICDDLNMKFIGYFSADSWDLLYPKWRARWLLFAENFFEMINKKSPTVRQFPPLTYRDYNYIPGEIIDNKNKINIDGKKVLIVTDSTDKQTNLEKMINRFQESFSEEVEVINIYDIDIKGGCIGCIKCGHDHQCIYKGKDDFIEFWEEKVMKADVLIYAGNIKDRFLSSRWKMINDRAFYKNHTPTLIGKQMGYIISGPLSQIPNLKEILQALIEMQSANFVDIITDEFGDSAEIDLLLHNFARQLIKFSKLSFIKPQTFLGVAGMKIFRDDVYGRNRFIFQADHKYYEEHGIYQTFPQNDKRAIEMNKKLIPLFQIDKIREKMDLSKEFLRPFKRVIADPNK